MFGREGDSAGVVGSLMPEKASLEGSDGVMVGSVIPPPLGPASSLIGPSPPNEAVGLVGLAPASGSNGEAGRGSVG